MTCNIGTTDRIVRVLLGVAIIAAGLYFKSWWGLIGLVPLATAATGWCAVYRLIGISTCEADVEQGS